MYPNYGKGVSMDKNGLTGKNDSEKPSNRRNFIKTSAAVGAASLVAGTSSSVHAATGKNRRKLRIGALAVGEMSFWPYSWGDILFPHGTHLNQGSLETDLLNMEITHVWDVNYEEAQKFA